MFLRPFWSFLTLIALRLLSFLLVHRPRAEIGPFWSSESWIVRQRPDISRLSRKQLQGQTWTFVGAIFPVFLSRLSCSISIGVRHGLFGC